MEANEKALKAAKIFSSKVALDIVSYVGMLDDYPVYSATTEALKGTTHGFPVFVIVRQKNGVVECRFATQQESLKIMSKQKKI